MWNEHFTTLIDDVNQVLYLRAYDQDLLSDDFLGMACVDISSLRWNE